MTFKIGQLSAMKDRTKISGLYPKKCGFQEGHEHYTTKGDFKKRHTPWNKQKKIELKCLYCGKIFLVSQSRENRKYCSKECSNKAMKGQIRKRERFIHICQQCNKEYEVRRCELKSRFCSRRCSSLAKPKTPTWGKYKGVNMRSGYEIGYAKYLDKNNIKWDYEPTTFDLGHTAYTPDFFLPEKEVYVEIKGWMRKEALIKIKEFIKQNPDIKYLLLGEKELKKMGVLK